MSAGALRACCSTRGVEVSGWRRPAAGLDHGGPGRSLGVDQHPAAVADENAVQVDPAAGQGSVLGVGPAHGGAPAGIVAAADCQRRRPETAYGPVTVSAPSRYGRVDQVWPPSAETCSGERIGRLGVDELLPRTGGRRETSPAAAPSGSRSGRSRCRRTRRPTHLRSYRQRLGQALGGGHPRRVHAAPVAAGMHPVGQQDHEGPGGEVDHQRGAGVAGVAGGAQPSSARPCTSAGPARSPARGRCRGTRSFSLVIICCTAARCAGCAGRRRRRR